MLEAERRNRSGGAGRAGPGCGAAPPVAGPPLRRVKLFARSNSTMRNPLLRGQEVGGERFGVCRFPGCREGGGFGAVLGERKSECLNTGRLF